MIHRLAALLAVLAVEQRTEANVTAFLIETRDFVCIYLRVWYMKHEPRCALGSCADHFCQTYKYCVLKCLMPRALPAFATD